MERCEGKCTIITIAASSFLSVMSVSSPVCRLLRLKYTLAHSNCIFNGSQIRTEQSASNFRMHIGDCFATINNNFKYPSCAMSDSDMHTPVYTSFHHKRDFIVTCGNRFILNSFSKNSPWLNFDTSIIASMSTSTRLLQSQERRSEFARMFGIGCIQHLFESYQSVARDVEIMFHTSDCFEKNSRRLISWLILCIVSYDYATVDTKSITSNRNYDL